MDLNQNLSPNFRLIEFVISETARRLKIDNTPTDDVVLNLIDLCENVLEPLRTLTGSPIRILSGYRCLALNTAVGGATGSQHMEGQAADLRVDGQTVRQTFDMIAASLIQFDQLIEEKYTTSNPNSGWIHISWVSSTENRRQEFKIS